MGFPADIGFGERLKAARLERGLSGSELGRGLQADGDASRQTISDWEAERHYPNVWQLRELCMKLNKSADFFLFGEAVQESAKLQRAKLAVKALSDEERLDLFTAIAQPGLTDHEVEDKIPATRRRVRAKG